jgi:CheY-like chemotaxis protein
MNASIHRRYAIHPFAFPTTVAIVDDSASFLSNLSMRLDPHLAFRLFHSPFAAMVALNGSNAMPPRVQKFFSLYEERGEASDAYHVVNLNLTKIHREVHNEHRFDQVSVVVVDYDMPELNGLEFCRNIKNPAIRKILLTGKADEQIAVAAFNDRIIDRFIRKQDADAMTQLNRAIADLQRGYFVDIERMLSDALAVGEHAFLFDEKFATRFQQIRDELHIVEHYLSCMPEGILMLDMHGAAYLLLVMSEDVVRGNYEIAYDQEAPDALLDQLRSGQVVPYFWKTEGHYSPVYKDWQATLHPATEFKGKDWYLYAVVKNPPAFNLKHVVPYGEFLGRLDEEEKAKRVSLVA